MTLDRTCPLEKKKNDLVKLYIQFKKDLNHSYFNIASSGFPPNSNLSHCSTAMNMLHLSLLLNYNCYCHPYYHNYNYTCYYYGNNINNNNNNKYI